MSNNEFTEKKNRSKIIINNAKNKYKKINIMKNNNGTFILRNFSTSNLPNGGQPWIIERIPNNDPKQRTELIFPRLQPNSEESN